MGVVAVRALKVIIAIALVGSVLVQCVMVPLIWLDMDDARPGIRVPFVAIVVLGVATLQVTGVCIWRLLTMVRRGTVFSHGAFRYVDTVIGAVATASVLTFAVAVLAAYSNRTTPGDQVAPGLVGLVCGASLVVAGVAVLVLVLRVLLVQAVALDAEARQLQSELDEVI
ncbi:DUF2975 domain-containing protein [Nocardioides sp. MAHUQ-72]|uniref:DUF2975 domain-containing protein n=1 Tax=unclassified Nocardioides TaxID=2615069 RepID=UPI00361951CA